MANTFAVSRNHLIFGLCLPVAVLLGYVLAEPLDRGTLAVIGILSGLLMFPLMMKYHHPLLLVSWNAMITPYFLPGKPALWMLMAAASLFCAILARTVSGKPRFIEVTALNRALLCLLGVVLITGFLTGGFGSQMFGSRSVGGKGYYVVTAAILGYFALTSQAIPREKANWAVAAFFLAGTTAIISNLLYFTPKLWFLYELFPASFAEDQAAADASLGDVSARIGGMVLASQAVYGYMLARYGLRGIFDLSRPWRLAMLLGTVFLSMFGGFRASLVFFGMLFLSLFFFERLWKTRVMVTLMAVGVVLGVLLVCFVDRAPYTVQRTLSFLPLNINPAIKQSTQDSTQWRVEMWKVVWPDVPKYLFLGKGYALDPQMLNMMTDDAQRGGYAASYEWAAFTGDYHNGFLSVIIPFGIYGIIAFLWFLWVGIRVLRNNYRYGAPWLRQVNTFLLALFVARSVYFFLVFGAFYAELFFFTGILGLSVALNGGERREPWEMEDAMD